jgi:hypothetical protein
VLLVGGGIGMDRLLENKLDRRTRLLITSGGDSPVPDDSGNGHSAFAEAFLEELETNDRVLNGQALYVQLMDRLEANYGVANMPQEPELKVIKGAGHEAGDFFFVPTGSGG